MLTVLNLNKRKFYALIASLFIWSYVMFLSMVMHMLMYAYVGKRANYSVT